MTVAVNLFPGSGSTAPALPLSPSAVSCSMCASYPLAVYPDNSYLVGSGRGRLVSSAIVFLFSRENARFFNVGAKRLLNYCLID